MRRLVLTVTLALATLPVAPATASTVAVHVVGVGEDGSTVADVTAAAGEQNAVSFTRVGEPTVLVSDTGATLTAATGCTSLDLHHARCTSPHTFLNAAASLGDGDDTLSSAVDIVRADGGAGNDRLTASAPAHSLGGGAGDDVLSVADGPARPGLAGTTLHGDAGDDTLTGGGSDDILSGGPGSDTLVGGGGRDIATWSGNTVPVRVDLTVGRARTGGDRDTMSSIEDARGGFASDVLIGNAGPNRLSSPFRRDGRDDPADTMLGSGGDDTLNGYGHGPDRLFGGAGNDGFPGSQGDQVDAGAGDDVIVGGAHVGCGSGFDHTFVDAPSLAGFVARDCERIVVAGTAALSPVRRRAGGLAILAADPGTGGALPTCGAAVRVTRGSRTLAGGRVRFRIPQAVGFRLALTHAGRRTLRAGTTEVRVRFRLATACPATGAWPKRATAGFWRQIL